MIRYRKGRSREHILRRKLERTGWFVVRSAGSKGVFDLVAVKEKVVGIQVKGRKPFRDEILRIVEVTKGRNIKGVVAVIKERRWEFYEVGDDGKLRWLSPSWML